MSWDGPSCIPTFVGQADMVRNTWQQMMSKNERTRSGMHPFDNLRKELGAEPTHLFYRDIGALLTHIKTHMQDELDSSRVAVTGGSCE
jgi:hypothetical protein